MPVAMLPPVALDTSWRARCDAVGLRDGKKDDRVRVERRTPCKRCGKPKPPLRGVSYCSERCRERAAFEKEQAWLAANRERRLKYFADLHQLKKSRRFAVR